MKNVPEQYHKVLRSKNLVLQCLERAKERFPDQELGFCGSESNWEDCLGMCLPNRKGTELSVLFHFNVGDRTYAITEHVSL